MSPNRPVRIGDAEREAAASALTEHYAAGRLDKQEHDERLQAVWEAKFDVDLRTIFADLPRPHGPLDQPAQPAEPAEPSQPSQQSHSVQEPQPDGRRGLAKVAHLWWLVPLAMLGFVYVFVLGIRSFPLFLVVGLAIACLGGCGGGRGRGHNHT
ncbi:DUF1707 domain-containing protein [Actinobacteria bacterium YIM 96077]|uniref:DUF1707 domain-containing protein n=1 Tax=Phytoactinopolyspora halophila TaxID=1981511 RepID=A0A329R2T7_9ACTN|nr:DUF1707 domain-containing protein [Phytoactinopolyspora halophila]AYY11752.1 DUF1707 domain-containing protein [Actinobacteria bacterium YIM 96077]RAW17812.1 hypothetical protein DPM12_02850 [Phytoactinopolyspora halophila]